MTKEEKQIQLDALERAYFSGMAEVTIGEQTVKYASLDKLWDAILRLKQSIADDEADGLAGNGGRVQAVAGRGYRRR